MATSGIERSAIDTAAAYLAGRDGRTTIGAVAATCLPHRDLGENGALWTRHLWSSSYQVESGRNADGRAIGIPCGAKGRIILLHFIDGAIRSGSQRIAVRPSMGGWIESLGVPHGGMSYRRMADHARRIAACAITIASPDGELLAGPIVEALGYRDEPDVPALAAANSEGGSFPEVVVLDSAFYDHVSTHQVALDGTALDLISDNSWVIDMYVWLSALLPGISHPVEYGWDDLLARIDCRYVQQRRARRKVLDSLILTKSVYPAADIEVTASGVTFRPSAPPAELAKHA